MEGYPDDWEARRSRVFRRDDWTCQRCGRAGGRRGDAELHAHHKVPKSKGGSHNVSNLTTICDRCHAVEHDDPRLLSSEQNRSSGSIGHLKVFALTFWSFGLGNLVYHYYRKIKRGDMSYTLPRYDEIYSDAENDYNDEYGGCPECDRRGLTIKWRSDGQRKWKVIECRYCGAKYKETSGDQRLKQVADESEIPSTHSALAQEIEKHIERGTIDGSNINEFKQEILQETDTKEERRHANRVFEKYERRLK